MGLPIHVLIVEDSEDDSLLLLRELRRGGYQPTFERVDTPTAMKAALTQQAWDIVIADYSMPHFSGTAALSMVRESKLDMPFIFVSGTIGEETAVAAMKFGAQDYIMKGNLSRLVPAVERELRETEVRRQRRLAEEALRKSEARYRELVENATYGIFRSSVEGNFVDVNRALVTMLGYNSKEELLAANVATDIYLRPSDRSKLINRRRKDGRIEGVEVEWKRNDGKTILVRLSGRTVYDERSEFEGFELIAEDVTERRLLEKQISTLQKFEAIGKLAGGIAHDFNNVIGVIMGWGEIGSAETAQGSRPHDLFRKICDQSWRAAGLTRQLLAFARRQILEAKKINLNQTVVETTSMLDKLIGPQIEMKPLLAPDLHVTWADPTQVEQVLMNLCINARDAMPQGGRLIIETRNVDLDEDYCRRHVYARPGRYVLLAVSDTGVGMDAATLEHIFEPFFTTKESGKGTGLGLATVYGIVKQHNGIVHVYSEPGHGTTFRIYLPVAEGTTEERRNPQAETIRGGHETILLAEDHKGLREMARETLEGLGYSVLTASDGEEAIRMFEAHVEKIELALLDVVMPKLNGTNVYSQLSGIKPGLPVILTTGYSEEVPLLNSVLEKGAAILQKPYTPKLLSQKIRELLDREC